MEASAAGLAGDGAEAQQQDGQEAPQGADLSALTAQLTDQSAQLEQMRGWMEQNVMASQPDPAAEEEPQPPDLSFVDPESPTYDPQRAAAQLLDVLQQQNQQSVADAVAPLQQQLTEVQASREADALAAEFPDLADPETADAVIAATRQWVAAAGLPESTAGNMQVVRAVYMMGRAAELANQEQAGDGQQQAASLEGAGGASPGGGQGGLTAESIVGTGARSVLPF